MLLPFAGFGARSFAFHSQNGRGRRFSGVNFGVFVCCVAQAWLVVMLLMEAGFLFGCREQCREILGHLYSVPFLAGVRCGGNRTSITRR